MTTQLCEPVNASFTNGMEDLVTYHQINIILGAATTVVNLLLLCVFTASSKLRRKSEILIVLCVADGINCFSIFLMGMNRMFMYLKIIDTLTIPVRTSWECALEPWLLFKEYGDLWPPTVQLAMGIDRCIAVFDPFLHNERILRRKGAFFVATFTCVTIELAIGYYISWNASLFKVMYYCGRKAAFGNTYATFIYSMNIVCYVLAFLLTLTAFLRSQYYLESDAAKRLLTRFKYQLIISILSIILVSIPNGISLFSQYIVDVADAISRPSTYLICINSAINIAVYMALHEEFRSEFMRMICRRR